MAQEGEKWYYAIVWTSDENEYDFFEEYDDGTDSIHKGRTNSIMNQ